MEITNLDGFRFEGTDRISSFIDNQTKISALSVQEESILDFETRRFINVYEGETTVEKSWTF